MRIISSTLLFLCCFLIANTQDLSSQLDSIVAKARIDGPGYAIQIDQNGQNLYTKAVGYANLELEVPMSNAHIFRIGSITKQFTAVAILKLAEEGKLSLSDPIEKHISDYPTLGKTIRIEHLLNHTSGIKSYTSLEHWDAETRKKDFTVTELIDYFKNEPMDFDPGDRFKYNNSGYILLGHIIELVSGTSYADYLTENFFKPLNMRSTSYGEHGRLIKNRASGYAQDDQGKLQNAPYLSMSQPYAGGSLLSTTDDLSKWYHAIFSDSLISKESREKAHSPFTLNNGELSNYGYGWTLTSYKDLKIIQHGGGINGFSSASAYIPAKQTFITVLANSSSLNPNKLLQKLAATAIGLPIQQPKSIQVPVAQLRSYEGDYTLSPALTIHIKVQGEELIAQATGQPSFALIPIEEHTFFVEEIEAKVVFNLENKEVQSLTLHQGGAHLAPKLK